MYYVGFKFISKNKPPRIRDITEKYGLGHPRKNDWIVNQTV